MHDKHRKYKTHIPFDEIYPSIVNKTMLAKPTLKMVYELAIICDILPGDVAEAGVWAGGCSYLLASVMTDKKVHLLDSWDGLPELQDIDKPPFNPDYMPKGWGKCDPPYELMKGFGDRITFHQGLFKDTLCNLTCKQFCFVHIDCDRYASVKECAEFFYPKMIRGGIIVFDDYTFIGTPGAIKAVDEFLEGKAVDNYYDGDGMVIVC